MLGGPTGLVLIPKVAGTKEYQSGSQEAVQQGLEKLLSLEPRRRRNWPAMSSLYRHLSVIARTAGFLRQVTLLPSLQVRK